MPSTEEDHSVSKSIPFPVEGNAIHKCPDSYLVVFRRLDCLFSKTCVSPLEVGVHHPVGEATHTDPNSFKHTIASKLVHDQRRLNLSWLLVVVGHQTTYEVGLARIQGGHQLNQGDPVKPSASPQMTCQSP